MHTQVPLGECRGRDAACPKPRPCRSAGHRATPGAQYALADPQQFPCVGIITMRDADPSAVSIGGVGPGDYIDRQGQLHSDPGIFMDLTHSVGHSILSPVGIAKLTKS